MKRLNILISTMLVAIIGILASCSTKETVAYTLAENYYVRNDVSEIDSPVIYNQQSFDSIFGMAASMGHMPTAINFSKQTAVAIVLPETTNETAIEVRGVSFDGTRTTVEYSVTEGRARSYTIRPFSLVLIDKKYGAEVKLVRK